MSFFEERMSMDKSARLSGLKPIWETIKGAPAAFKAQRTAAAMSKMRAAARAERAATRVQPAATPPRLPGMGTGYDDIGSAATAGTRSTVPAAATGFAGKVKAQFPELSKPGLLTKFVPGKKMMLAGAGYGGYEAGRATSDYVNYGNIAEASRIGQALGIEGMRTPSGRLSAILPDALFEEQLLKRYPHLAEPRHLARQLYHGGDAGNEAFRKIVAGDHGLLATLYKRHLATPPELPR